MIRREMKIQNVYVCRLIRSIQMGIAVSGSSYIDKFLYELYGHRDWDGLDVSWTQYFVSKMDEVVNELQQGTKICWEDSDLFTLIAKKDPMFWDSIGVPMKTCEDIRYQTVGE